MRKSVVCAGMIIAVLAMVIPLFTFTSTASAVTYGWARQENPKADQTNLFGLSALDPTHVWATSGKDILFYDGSKWAVQASFRGISGFECVEALDANHVWAAGGNHVFFYDGSQWREEDLSGVGNTLNQVPSLTSIDASDASHVWVVGYGGGVLFYDGTKWSGQIVTDCNLLGVSAMDANHVWAVGTEGAILFYNGASWKPQNGGTKAELWGVCALDAAHVWAVGGSTGGKGTLLFYDGGQWTAQRSNAGNTLRGVSAVDPNHVWVTGEGGTILFWDGNSSIAEYSGTSVPLLQVSACDANHIWVVGCEGVILAAVPNMKNYYFAEGSTREGFEEWLCLQNSGSSPVEVHATYMPAKGMPTPKTYPLPPTSRTSISVNREVGPGQDVSISLWGAGDFYAERSLYFDYKQGQPGYSWTGGSCVTGVPMPRNDWYFAEGTTRDGFEEWICLMNPQDTDVSVRVEYISAGAYLQKKDYGVPAHSRVSVFVNGDVGPNQDVSVHVYGLQPIVAERPMYFNYKGKWDGGHDIMGINSPENTWYFAEGSTQPGFDEYLAVQNINNADAHMTVHFLKSNGTRQDNPYTVPANSRWTVDVSEPLGKNVDSAVFIESDQPVVAERPMYFCYKEGDPGYGWTGGHDVAGAPEPRKNWCFAEGCTLSNFDEYICIGNPGSDKAHVTFRFILGNGKVVEHGTDIGPGMRATVKVAEVVGRGQDVSTQIASDRPVVAERPMYFNYQDKWTGGDDVLGFTP